MSAGKKIWELTGDKKLNRKLQKMEMKIVKKEILKPAIKKTLAERLLPAVKQNLPTRTGNLAKLTKVRAMKRSRKAYGFMVSNSDKKTKGGGLGANFSGDAYYGGMVEYGTKQRFVSVPVFVSAIGSQTLNRGSMPAMKPFSRAYALRKKRLVQLAEMRIKKLTMQVATRG